MDKSDRQSKYGYLNQLSTTYLEGILRADIESSEGGDEDMILYILEVIEEREKGKNDEDTHEVDEAWKEFQENYMDLEDPLYPTSSLDSAGEVGSTLRNVKNTPIKSEYQHSSAHKISRTFLRRLIPIAATIAVLLAGMVTAQAAGLDVFGALARWTDDTFRFISPSSKYEESGADLAEGEIDPDIQELCDTFRAVLDGCGISTSLAPNWFPNGCVATGEPKIISTDYATKVSCEYITSSEEMFVISVQKYSQSFYPELLGTEKDGGPVKYYLANNKLFYIMSNNGSINAAWSDSKLLSVKVFGDIPFEILKQLLDSIGE